jgi:hypothetical protein
MIKREELKNIQKFDVDLLAEAMKLAELKIAKERK